MILNDDSLKRFYQNDDSFTFESEKNRLPHRDFWGLRHLKKYHATPLSLNTKLWLVLFQDFKMNCRRCTFCFEDRETIAAK